MALRRDATTSSHDYESLAPRPSHMEDDDDDVGQRPPRPKKKKAWQRFGLTSFFILFLGSAILLLVLLILGLLWKSSTRAANGGPAETPWVYIFRANRATTVVALCAALLRTVIGLQSSVATGMLAGIILETIGAPLLKAPFYSIIRAVSVAPSNLLSAIRSRRNDILSFFIYTLVVLEVLLAVASQFLSAILTTDFAEGTFANINNSTDVRLFVHERAKLGVFTKYWELPPASGWTFAESSEPFTKGASFDDTGHTYRAFLPFEDEGQRTRLRKFRGPAHVIDHRVVCATPSLRNLSLIRIGNVPQWALSGQIAMETTLYPMLKEVEPQHYINFTCALATPTEYTDIMYGESSLCAVNSRTWTILLDDPLIVPVFEDNINISPDRVGHPKGSTMYMILDIVSGSSMLNPNRDREGLKVVRNDGPWVMAAGGQGLETLRITGCMTNLPPKAFTVDIHSAWENPEPRLTWDYQAKRYNTEAARHQLGASLTPESFEKRQVLTLSPRSQWQDFPNKTGIRDTPFYFPEILEDTLERGYIENGPTDDGIILSEGYQMIDNNAYISHIHPFQDTLNTTKSPALALQVLLARITQMVYYDGLLRLEKKSAASVSFSSTALIPMKWTGLIAATALVVMHLAHWSLSPSFT